jgi:hypothetical protein
MTVNNRDGNNSIGIALFRTRSVTFKDCQDFLRCCNSQNPKSGSTEKLGLFSVRWWELIEKSDLSDLKDESFRGQINCRLKEIGRVEDIELNKSGGIYQLSFKVKYVNSELEELYPYVESSNVEAEIGKEYALCGDNHGQYYSHLFLYIPNFDCYWVFSPPDKPCLAPGKTTVSVTW